MPDFDSIKEGYTKGKIVKIKFRWRILLILVRSYVWKVFIDYIYLDYKNVELSFSRVRLITYMNYREWDMPTQNELRRNEELYRRLKAMEE